MAEKSSKHIPPLVYVVLGILVLWGVWAAVNWRSTYTPPSGGPVIGQTQAGGGEPPVVQAPYVPGPTAPPAPTGSGPTNEPGVTSGPDPRGRPS